MFTTKTICPEPRVKRRLDHPAEASCRSTSDPAAEAIRDCVDLSEWQTREIRIAVAEAESGDFASDDLVRDVLGNWGSMPERWPATAPGNLNDRTECVPDGRS